MEDSLSKVWSIAVIVFSSLVSFFMYRQKKMDESLIELDKRIDIVQISQAKLDSSQSCYTKSVDQLMRRFDRIEKKLSIKNSSSNRFSHTIKTR